MPFVFDRSISILRAHRASVIRYLGPLCLLLGIPFCAASQSTAPARPDRQEETSAAPPVDELQERLKAAEAARNTGDPGSVARANFPVLSLALRKLGNVRTTEGAFPEAAELYRRSLTWEDAAETHVGLAICNLYANRPDDSLVEASKALLLDPNSARAFNIQGKAWMKKREYRRAVDSLERAVRIQPEFEPAYALASSLLSLKDSESKKKSLGSI